MLGRRKITWCTAALPSGGSCVVPGRAGCELRFLPPYSPDLYPIEPAWSKLKALLRTVGARTTAALHDALAGVLDAITPDDARGYFQHCGYGRYAAP